MLLNKTNVKKFILAEAQRMRPGWDCTRVAGGVYTELETMIQRRIRGELERHPTLGKTFRME